jgi:tetratricopeptide (TPR) repeat protein
MEDIELQTKISKLVFNWDALEEAEKLILDYLKVNPQDIDAWSRLVILETLSPIEDYERATEYLNIALKYHKDNSIFLVLMLFFTDWYLGGLNQKLVEKVLEIKQTADCETSSILSYILAWHYKSKDICKYESLLNASIHECAKHVTNYTDLGKHYLSKGEKELGTTMIREGIANVKIIYKDSNIVFDPLDITRFVNERITGIFMTEDTYHSLEKLILA